MDWLDLGMSKRDRVEASYRLGPVSRHERVWSGKIMLRRVQVQPIGSPSRALFPPSLYGHYLIVVGFGIMNYSKELSLHSLEASGQQAVPCKGLTCNPVYDMCEMCYCAVNNWLHRISYISNLTIHTVRDLLQFASLLWGSKKRMLKTADTGVIFE